MDLAVRWNPLRAGCASLHPSPTLRDTWARASFVAARRDLSTQLAATRTKRTGVLYGPPQRMSTARPNKSGAHELRCRYPGTRCENPRSMKRNGEMHRMCEYHRRRANLNQKRLDQRKKELKSEGQPGQLEHGSKSDEAVAEKQGGDQPGRAKPRESFDSDDDDEEFRASLSEDPDELDDKEIEELQALIVAEQLQRALENANQRIDP